MPIGAGRGGPADTDDDDLWFLPGPAEDDDLPPGAPPLPQAPQHRPLFDPADWRAAQDALSADLARLTQIFGELDLRLRGDGGDARLRDPAHDPNLRDPAQDLLLRDPAQGLRQRLALREAADLTWWSGERLAPDRLGLWHVLRIGSTEDTEQAFARAGWALRRLSSGPPPAAGLAAFLDRARGADQPRPDPGAVADLSTILADIHALHPVTQAAILFQAWQMLGAPLSRAIEAATMAARHAALMSRKPGQGALFVPLATSGADTFRGHGGAEARLRIWISGAERATLAALLHLEHVSQWQARAQVETADLSGRTPARLIAALARWPMVSAPMAEAETGASRAAVQRNLDRLAARGLIREVTGQGRYRLWTLP